MQNGGKLPQVLGMSGCKYGLEAVEKLYQTESQACEVYEIKMSVYTDNC